MRPILLCMVLLLGGCALGHPWVAADSVNGVWVEVPILALPGMVPPPPPPPRPTHG